MNEPIRRLSYVLKDINTLKPSDYIPNEILLDYKENDIVIIDENKEVFSIKKFIEEQLLTKLSSDHTILSNQHALVDINKQLPGFMSYEDKVILGELYDHVQEYAQLLENNRMNSKFDVLKLEYSISNKKISIDTVVNNVGSLITVSETLDLGSRPDKGFTNADDKYGYRHDMLCVKITPNSHTIEYYNDIVYTDEFISIDGRIMDYKSDKCIYDINGVDSIVPLILIKRRNNEIVSENNIYGKYSDNNISKEEIIDISRRTLPQTSYGRVIEKISEVVSKGLSYGDDVTKIIKSNLEYEIDDQTITYIAFDGNDNDIISGSPLNKHCSFKPSPFGRMMSHCERDGNVLSLKHNNREYKVDMILDIIDHDNITSQSIFSIYSALINETMLDLEYMGKGNFKLSYNNGSIYETFSINDLDMVTNRYVSIVLYVSNHNIYCLLNGNVVCNIDTSIDIRNMANFKVNSKSFPIGNVLITNNVADIINKYVNDNVILMEKFDVASRNVILEHKTATFTSKDSIINNDISLSVYTDGVESVQIKEGSVLEFHFDKELAYNINSITTIDTIDGNKISLVNGNFRSVEAIGIFNIGDSILISKDINGCISRDIFNIVSIYDNDLVLDRDVDVDFIGYHISNMSNTNYIRLTDSQSNEVGSIGIRDNEVKVIARRSYTSSSIFKLEYIEKKHASNIMDCIKDVENVTFDGNKIESSDTNIIKKINMSHMSAKLNGGGINKSPKNIAIFDEGDIKLEMKYDLSKSIERLDKVLISNAIEVVCRIRVSNGEHALTINNNSIESNNYLRWIDVPLCIENNVLALDILSERTGDTTNKIIIEDLSIIIKFKDDFNKIFVRRNNLGTIVDYLIMSNDEIYCNVSPLTMTISEKVDSFEFDKELLLLSEEINGYRLVADRNRIVKALQVCSGKIYRLEKYYII